MKRLAFKLGSIGETRPLAASCWLSGDRPIGLTNDTAKTGMLILP
jgi:electron transfer flavoprotein alpha subunit